MSLGGDWLMQALMDRKFSIGIVDDHPIFRRGLAAVVRDEPYIGEVFEGDSTEKAIQIADQHEPDLMILDLMMPGGGGMAALSRIAKAHPSILCVVLTISECPDIALATLNEGARGFILKGIPGGEFIAALRTVLRGDTFVAPAFAKRLLTAAQESKARRDPIGALTHREEQVLRELKSGHSNREIAVSLSITEKTVKFYMSSIMQKLGAKNRVEALVVYQRANAATPSGSSYHF
jgi:two-component system nitrate/nitrite response regulator NarL